MAPSRFVASLPLQTRRRSRHVPVLSADADRRPDVQPHAEPFAVADFGEIQMASSRFVASLPLQKRSCHVPVLSAQTPTVSPSFSPTSDPTSFPTEVSVASVSFRCISAFADALMSRAILSADADAQPHH